MEESVASLRFFFFCNTKSDHLEVAERTTSSGPDFMSDIKGGAEKIASYPSIVFVVVVVVAL